MRQAFAYHVGDALSCYRAAGYAVHVPLTLAFGQGRSAAFLYCGLGIASKAEQLLASELFLELG